MESIEESLAFVKSGRYECAAVSMCGAKKQVVDFLSSCGLGVPNVMFCRVVAVLRKIEHECGVDVEIFRYASGELLAEIILNSIRHGLVEDVHKWCRELCELLVSPLLSRKGFFPCEWPCTEGSAF